MSRQIFLTAIGMISAGIPISVVSISQIGGPVYAALAFGVSVVFLGTCLLFAPWEKIK